MSFAKTVKTELRNTFGPQWVASAVNLAVIAGGLVLVGIIGLEVLEIAKNGISAELENLAK